jgi:hypothetical protein
MTDRLFNTEVQGLLDLFRERCSSFFVRFNDLPAQGSVNDRPVTVTDSLKFNASVAKTADGYVRYAVTAGAILALTDLSVTLGATKSFVRDMPINGKTFDTRTFRSPSQFVDYSELLGSRGEALPFVPFRMVFEDPSRQAIGYLVSDLSVRFLMMHEQMHFVRGHLHYLAGVNPPGDYEEIPENRRSDLDSLDVQALEIDADAGAFAAILDMCGTENQTTILQSATAQYKGTGVTTLFCDPWGWARIVGLSSQLVMLLLSLRGQRDSMHPAVQTRMLSLLGIYEHFLRRKTTFTPNQQVLNFFSDLVAVAETLGVNPPEMAAFIEWKTTDPKDFRNPTCIQLRDLQKRFQVLLPRLR